MKTYNESPKRGLTPKESFLIATLARGDRKMFGIEDASPLLDMVSDWGRFLSAGVNEGGVRLLRRHERTGRPLGSVHFLDRLEGMLGRCLRPRKAGRKAHARGK